MAPIGQYGLVTARAVGTARITATVEGPSGSATVRVIEQPEQSLLRGVVVDARQGQDDAVQPTVQVKDRPGGSPMLAPQLTLAMAPANRVEHPCRNSTVLIPA